MCFTIAAEWTWVDNGPAEQCPILGAAIGLKAELQRIFGSPEPGEAGLKVVREAMEKTGARDKVREYMKCFAMEASDRIASLPQEAGACAGAAREAFHDLFRYSVERRS